MSKESLPRGGTKIKVPQGDTVESLVKHGMCLKEKNAVIAAKVVGLNKDTFMFVRRLLTLQKGEALNEEERKIVGAALTEINETRQIRNVKPKVRAILKRHWTPYTTTGSTKVALRKENKAVKKFNHTLFIIRETCTNNEEMEIPNLSVKETTEAITSIAESITGLTTLLKAIQKGKD